MHDQQIAEISERQAAWGEPTPMGERVVVAPCGGKFHPLPAEIFTSEGEWVEPGSLLATITEGSMTTDVHATARGWVMGMLAFPGHAVRRGEALFWIRS